MWNYLSCWSGSKEGLVRIGLSQLGQINWLCLVGFESVFFSINFSFKIRGWKLSEKLISCIKNVEFEFQKVTLYSIEGAIKLE